MIQAVSLSRLDKYSFFSAAPQSWSFFYANHPRLCFCAETGMILFYAAAGGPWTGWGWAVERFFNLGEFCSAFGNASDKSGRDDRQKLLK